MAPISYMGTKGSFSKQIAATFQSLPSGPLLDLFAGMASVGRSAADHRNIWLNDAQTYSTISSQTQFLNCNASALRLISFRRALRTSKKVLVELSAELANPLAIEASALASRDPARILAAEAVSQELCTSPEHRQRAIKARDEGGYRLFVSTYAGSYFGLRQCIEIDALRAGIDVAAPAEDGAYVGVRRWMLTALGAAVSRCSNSTGHFAQYLTPSADNVARVASKRRRSICLEWVDRLRLIKQVGNYTWRKQNRVFCGDACVLLNQLASETRRPAIIYADPPYTSDQYSRYYHLLETLALYDYPQVTGKGLYRPGRFSSDWSIKSKVVASFEQLVEHTAKLGASLVVSYPTHGLLENSETVIPEMMRNSFQSVERHVAVAHQHSTMGASKGVQRTDVVEQVFVGS